MSEIINNSEKRKEMLKHLILQLHRGEAPDIVRKRLIELLRSVPYDHVVKVEQELIAEGLPVEEILSLCDIHTSVLDGHIDTSAAQEVPQGHPVDTFKQENRALEARIRQLRMLFEQLPKVKENEIRDFVMHIRSLFNELADVDKHYLKKEYLLFPFMERQGITGPPKVMWGKHDETREFLKAAHEALREETIGKHELEGIIPLLLLPVLDAIEGMIMKEEEILLPMCLDALNEQNWRQIYEETPDFGFCLYDPQVEWKGDSRSLIGEGEPAYSSGGPIRLSSGSFDVHELEALFRLLPVDITFVDKDDKVKFFSHSPKRVFERNRSIIGRDVRMCHPPHSVHIVEQIISDFKSGKENSAAFWISNFKGRFVYIDYIALRGKDNEYLGVVEFTQDITDLRALQGDQRLLSYTSK